MSKPVCSQCVCLIHKSVQDHPYRSSLLVLVALVAISSLGLLLAGSSPSFQHFVSSLAGRCVLGSMSLLGFTGLGWIFVSATKKEIDLSHQHSTLSAEKVTPNEVTRTSKQHNFQERDSREIDRSVTETYFACTECASEKIATKFQLEPYLDSPFAKLRITNGRMQSSLVIRASTREEYKGYYRLVYALGDTYRESAFLFTLPQIATMAYCAKGYLKGIRLSGLNSIQEVARTGVAIFTTHHEPKHYFIVNKIGKLQVASSEQIKAFIRDVRSHPGLVM